MGLIAFLLVAAEKDKAEKVELGRGGVMRTILALVGLSALLFCTGCTHTSAVSTCRADGQRFVDENESYDAEYDSQFGATTVGQLSTRELLDRDEELIQCIGTDRRHEKLYRAVLYRDGSIEGNRLFKYMLDLSLIHI